MTFFVDTKLQLFFLKKKRQKFWKYGGGYICLMFKDLQRVF